MSVFHSFLAEEVISFQYTVSPLCLRYTVAPFSNRGRGFAFFIACGLFVRSVRGKLFAANNAHMLLLFGTLPLVVRPLFGDTRFLTL
jgi:hypothetical protein